MPINAKLERDLVALMRRVVLSNRWDPTHQGRDIIQVAANGTIAMIAQITVSDPRCGVERINLYFAIHPHVIVKNTYLLTMFAITRSVPKTKRLEILTGQDFMQIPGLAFADESDLRKPLHGNCVVIGSAKALKQLFSSYDSNARRLGCVRLFDV